MEFVRDGMPYVMLRGEWSDTVPIVHSDNVDIERAWINIRKNIKILVNIYSPEARSCKERVDVAPGLVSLIICKLKLW